MPSTVRRAGPANTPGLLDLMTEFYAESGYRLDRSRAAAAFESLFQDPRLGLVWLVDLPDGVAGYLVLTTCYSMEYGGCCGWVDDLFIAPARRNQGLAGQLLDAARRQADAMGLRALHVEAAADNAPAQRAYGRAGFVPVERQLLTLELADPTHRR
jgi:GNAT superfamily N-acetyltransferase